MDRRQSLLRNVDVDAMVGLEMGPLDKPLVPRAPGRPIYYADYAPREKLQAQSATNPHVNIDAIPDIDFITAPLPDSLPIRPDYIIASHVVEHVPNLIGWVNTLTSWLSDDGRLILAAPDKRYTFDVLRPLSTLGEVLEAYREKRERPSYAQVFDGFSMAAKYEPAEGWANAEPSGERYYTQTQALSLAERSGAEYIDCHCWVFTAESFGDLVRGAALAGALRACVDWIEPPAAGSNEFHVALRR